MSRTLPSLPAAWAGIVLGPLGAALHHLAAASLVYHDCTRGGAALTLGSGLAAALLILAGGVASLRAWRGAGVPMDEPQGGARRFLGALGTCMAVFFLVLVAVQAASGLFLTGCER
ncbi:MAG TPA: hypothetical protein VEB20_05435 [Azospirillaceae bacterium]|nr:hypothetical protein [Azospirillaceae bacterium]